MKYRAVIMCPKVVEFELEGDDKNVSNQAWALCNKFDCVVTPEVSYVPRLLLVIPEFKPGSKMPLVFDPPPQAA